MSLTRIHNLSISLDGFATGEPQSAEAPFGHAGQRLHEWMIATRFWDADGSDGVDNAFASAMDLASAPRSWAPTSSARPGGRTTRTGRAGGARTRRSTHRPSCSPTAPGPRSRWRAAPRSTSSRPPRPSALETARAAADGQDVRIGGGPTVVRDFLAPGSSTTCMWSRSRSCSAAASASGTASRHSRSPTTSRRFPPPAASPTSPSRAGHLVNVNRSASSAWSNVG